MNYKELNGHTIREGFEKFNKENPKIFASFETQALRAIAKGRQKISAKLLINWIRWNEFIETTDEYFKINDAYQAYYAREFVKKHPEHDEVFNFRKLRNEISAPYMNIDKNGQISFL